jgi:multiple sugar transport system ATP-binding protein
MNFVNGRVTDGMVEIGGVRLELPQRFREVAAADATDVLVGLRPEAFQDAAGSDGARVLAEIEVTEQLGHETYAYFRIAGIEAAEIGERAVELAGALIARLGPRTSAEPGKQIPLSIDAGALHLFDAATGRSLIGDERPTG